MISVNPSKLLIEITGLCEPLTTAVITAVKQSKAMTRKPKPRSMKSKAELPPYASMNTRIQHKLNTNAANSTLKVYRMGWRYMWQVAAKTMRKCGVKEPGTFDKKNCHGGEMWGWPLEMNLTNARARKIMFAVIESTS